MARPKLQTAKGNPPNPSDVLQPAPIMTRTVAQVLNTRTLGYVYA